MITLQPKTFRNRRKTRNERLTHTRMTPNTGISYTPQSPVKINIIFLDTRDQITQIPLIIFTQESAYKHVSDNDWFQITQGQVKKFFFPVF